MGNDIELRNPGRAGAHPYRRLAKSDPLAVGLFFFLRSLRLFAAILLTLVPRLPLVRFPV